MVSQWNSGPIPGENFTSDTKNYPWRQPPEFTDIEPCLDYLAKRITQFKVANGIMSMAEMGLPLYKISSMILTMGVGEGKWTVDFTLALAGPLTRMIELICIGFDVEYELGIEEDEEDFNTGDFFKNDLELKSGDSKLFKVIAEEMPTLKSEAAEQGQPTKDLQSEGFMAMAGGNPEEAPTEAAPEETE